MKPQYTLMALALGAVLAGPALAQSEGDDAELYNRTRLVNDVTVSGNATVRGRISIASESKAVVDQDQTTEANGSLGDGDNSASASGDAMRGAQGNMGLNIAAGVGNVQSNDAALSSVDGDAVFAAAQVFNSQTTVANYGTDAGRADNQLFYDASLGDSVLSDAAGNIGVSVAAGAGNAQSNALAASTNSSGALAWATADSEQVSLLNQLAADVDLDNTASLSGSALSGAIGNIGVNIAAGVGNAQHNGLAIATASCGGCTPPPPQPPCNGCGGD